MFMIRKQLYFSQSVKKRVVSIYFTHLENLLLKVLLRIVFLFARLLIIQECRTLQNTGMEVKMCMLCD